MTDLDLAFFYFGMENPVVGGYTPDKVALRRAIALGYDVENAIRQIYRGQAVPAQSTVPPGSYGHDRTLSGTLAEYNPARAKALLETYHSRFNHPEWNRLFEQAKLLPDGPERSALFREMDKLFFAYAPLRPIAHRITTGLAQPWVIGYQRHPVLREFWKYVDIDTEALARAKK